MPAVAEAVAAGWRPPGVETGEIVPRGQQGKTRRRILAGVAVVLIMVVERVATAVPEL